MEGGGVGASATGEIRELDVRIVSLDVADDRFEILLELLRRRRETPVIGRVDKRLLEPRDLHLLRRLFTHDDRQRAAALVIIGSAARSWI